MNPRTATIGGAATALLATVLGGWWYVVGETDHIAPEISFVTPQEQAAVYGNVAIQVEATDDIGVQVVRFAIDDRASCVIVDPPYICVWNSVAAGQGERVLSATAYDAQGNRRNATIRVTAAALLEITTSRP